MILSALVCLFEPCGVHVGPFRWTHSLHSDTLPTTSDACLELRSNMFMKAVVWSDLAQVINVFRQIWS